VKEHWLAFQKVCSTDDVWEGEMKAFTVDGTEIVIVHAAGGELRAIQSVCPHQEVELAEGSLEGAVLTCRMHLWQFDVRTGKGVNPDHAELTLYPLKVEGEDVLVDVVGLSPKFARA
jgi:toluene monooxygenase system ferredoxin subunit